MHAARGLAVRRRLEPRDQRRAGARATSGARARLRRRRRARSSGRATGLRALRRPRPWPRVSDAALVERAATSMPGPHERLLEVPPALARAALAYAPSDRADASPTPCSPPSSRRMRPASTPPRVSSTADWTSARGSAAGAPLPRASTPRKNASRRAPGPRRDRRRRTKFARRARNPRRWPPPSSRRPRHFRGAATTRLTARRDRRVCGRWRARRTVGASAERRREQRRRSPPRAPPSFAPRIPNVNESAKRRCDHAAAARARGRRSAAEGDPPRAEARERFLAGGRCGVGDGSESWSPGRTRPRSRHETGFSRCGKIVARRSSAPRADGAPRPSPLFLLDAKPVRAAVARLAESARSYASRAAPRWPVARTRTSASILACLRRRLAHVVGATRSGRSAFVLSAAAFPLVRAPATAEKTTTTTRARRWLEDARAVRAPRRRRAPRDEDAAARMEATSRGAPHLRLATGGGGGGVDVDARARRARLFGAPASAEPPRMTYRRSSPRRRRARD